MIKVNFGLGIGWRLTQVDERVARDTWLGVDRRC